MGAFLFVGGLCFLFSGVILVIASLISVWLFS